MVCYSNTPFLNYFKHLFGIATLIVFVILTDVYQYQNICFKIKQNISLLIYKLSSVQVFVQVLILI